MREQEAYRRGTEVQKLDEHDDLGSEGEGEEIAARQRMLDLRVDTQRGL